ncbi:hypothetical protein C0989_009718 [Termitomyces sp. Mn162]|nr:hypothetical protein C0989_009718 [Termitomyces sp. Mn162]
MGVEEHRKKLMANNPTWGDRFTHVADGPCENPDDNLCSCEVGASTLSTPVDLMNHVVNPPSPLDSRISTCGWIFEDLLKKGKRFRPVPRVPLKEATKAIIRFDKDGVPLIIEDLHKESGWPKEDFHPDWLKDNGYKEISVRNVYDWTDKTMIFEDFIEKSRSMPTFASPQEMDGSSFWFMTKGSDAPEASKYFHELKQELDHETHVISVEQLANAPFDVYVAEQRLGDLVLVPPRSCHQVVNYGGITIKTSWSRMTLRGLEIAYYHELPIYRSSLQNYDEGSDRFFQTQRMGSKPDFTQQRAHLAEQYHTCKPLNSAFIQAGWYDVHVQLVPTIIEAKDNSTNSSQDSLTPPASPPLSPLTDLDSPLPLQVLPAPVKTTTVANMSLSLKRKRTVLDFVDVPSRMHKVRVSERLAVTPGGPEPSKSQETFPDLQVTSQLLSSDSTTPSVTADNVICERDQEVMQTDPLSSPPISRRNKASSHSTSQMLLILSTSEADSSNSSSFPSHKNKSKKQTFKKPQPLPSSPTSVMSRSTPILPRLTSSTLTRSPQPVNQLQTRIVSSTGESEKNSRLDRSFPPPITPDLGLARITDSEESRRKLVPVRKLPRIKKTFRTTQRVSPEVSSCQSSSSSSVYPRSTSTPSDVIDLAQVINGAVNKNYSALEALDADPPLTEQTPSNNNTATQAVHTTLTDSAALHKAISDITDAARNMTQLHNMPSQSHDPIRAAATAPGEV